MLPPLAWGVTSHVGPTMGPSLIWEEEAMLPEHINIISSLVYNCLLMLWNDPKSWVMRAEWGPVFGWQRNFLCIKEVPSIYSRFLTFTFVSLFLYYKIEGNPRLLALPKNLFMSHIVWIQIQNLLPIHPCVSLEYVPF